MNIALPFDPLREVELRIVHKKDGQDDPQTYRLRFDMRALDAAGNGYKIKPLSDGGAGVNEIIKKVSGDDLDALCGFLFFSMVRHHGDMTWADCWDLLNHDLAACIRARAEMFGLTMPVADPKEPPVPAPAETATPTETPTGA